MSSVIFRYFAYLLLSFIMGLLSYMAGESSDYIYKLSPNLITTLIALTTLYTALTNLVISQLAKIKDEKNVDILACINSLKRNIKIMFIIIGVDFLIFLLLKVNVQIDYILFGIIRKYGRLIIDMFTFFSLFYFLYVVYDTTMAFYNLFRENYC